MNTALQSTGICIQVLYLKHMHPLIFSKAHFYQSSMFQELKCKVQKLCHNHFREHDDELPENDAKLH